MPLLMQRPDNWGKEGLVSFPRSQRPPLPPGGQNGPRRRGFPRLGGHGGRRGADEGVESERGFLDGAIREAALFEYGEEDGGVGEAGGEGAEGWVQGRAVRDTRVKGGKHRTQSRAPPFPRVLHDYQTAPWFEDAVGLGECRAVVHRGEHQRERHQVEGIVVKLQLLRVRNLVLHVVRARLRRPRFRKVHAVRRYVGRHHMHEGHASRDRQRWLARRRPDIQHRGAIDVA
mmetsp:Transcript_59/g.111  ORF Transcript_59/g.111 Transcript_59/m.111 type:complete len:230 (-) Transcript_59:256-945(-)